MCSGTLYRDIIGDWSKSEAGRILLDPPLVLFAASRPFEDYPLELVLHLTVPRVEEREEHEAGHRIYSYHPDAEVAKDLAALLSLLCRRLITVAGKVNEKNSNYRHPLFDRMPLPLATSMQRICWPLHPSMILTGRETQEIEDYNPRPKPIDATRLTALLLGLPQLAHAKSIVASSRLYALALELIHERPDISYQLLISSVETLARSALSSFQPTAEAKVEHQRAVFDLALNLGLQKEQAEKLAIEACKREYWVSRKFKTFLMNNVNDSIWTEQDELFQIPPQLLPKLDAFERTLGKIYDARSKATHVGQPFPITATYVGGPLIPIRMALTLFESFSAFPPVVWFERVVNSAICGFWDSSLQDVKSDELPPATGSIHTDSQPRE